MIEVIDGSIYLQEKVGVSSCQRFKISQISLICLVNIFLFSSLTYLFVYNFLKLHFFKYNHTLVNLEKSDKSHYLY